MTNERVCANDEARPLEPVTDWENETVNGMARSSESCFDEGIAKVRKLRARQAAYLESLPSDPLEVIDAALKLMHPSGETYPDGFEEALHFSSALAALVKEYTHFDGGPPHEAALFIADLMNQSMRRTAKKLDRMTHILSNPGRIERLPKSS